MIVALIILIILQLITLAIVLKIYLEISSLVICENSCQFYPQVSQLPRVLLGHRSDR